MPDPNDPPAAPRPRAPGPFQLAVFDGDAVQVHPLPVDGRITIGRGDGNDIAINHPSVSRQHAILHAGPPLEVEDLGAANGTAVLSSRQRAQSRDTPGLRKLSRQTCEVAPGDWVTFGAVLGVIRRALPVPPPSAPGEGPSSASGEIVLRDPAMQALYKSAARAAQALISVLILGETGVGKEVLAQTIHQHSPRAKGPFVGLNCTALPESLLESELFGYEKGAFTGASQPRPGLFESARGGTVFLDEVGELPPSIQVKLLRPLQERQVLRVGARAPRNVDVRFIAATNRDLEAEVARGAFRQDLFFRLGGIVLTIPPLRRRVSEIEPLARGFVAGACRQLDRHEMPLLAPETLSALERYPWPGNVRELRNVIDRAVVLCEGDTLFPEHLPSKLTDGSPRLPPASQSGMPRGPAALEHPPRDHVESLEPPRLAGKDGDERRRIMAALERCAGNQTHAAALLGISRRTLITRIETHGIPRPRKRPDQA